MRARTANEMSEPVLYGKYRLIRRIAVGGMAEVMLARSSSIGGFEKILAIKRMHPRMSSHQGFVSLFIEEAKMWVALNHPNIVQVFDFGRVDDNYYIAMEFVDGMDLATIASRARHRGFSLDAAACLYIMKCVFEGIAYAHNKRDRSGKPAGIIHRDISPHNILVSFEGQVKISDFGIAKAVDELERLEKGEVVGKVAYISPEQAQGQVITTQGDIWSGGVVLYELLSNKRLFSRDTDRETLQAVANYQVESLLKFNPQLPGALDTIVQHILSRKVDERATSAREIAEALNDILGAYFPRMNEFRLSEIIAEMFEGEPLNSISDLEGSQPPRFTISGHPDVTQLMNDREFEDGMLSETDRPNAITDDLPVTSRPDVGPATKVKVQIEESIARLKVTFAESPSLWILVDIAGLYGQAQNARKAMAAYELAAAKFMQRGLTVQAITIYSKLLDTVGATPRIAEGIRRLPTLKGLSHDDLCVALLTSENPEDFEEFFNLLKTEEDDSPQSSEVFESPILSKLGPEQLQYLLSGLTLSRASSATTIAHEGSPGHSFFWIGRGRVVVSTKNFEDKRVYLTSLSEGDCFGEQAFFSGTARESSVETVDDCWILEVAKPVIERLIEQFPPVLETLRQFYRERIAESLIARSELLGSMSIHHRRRLADQFSFMDVAKGAILIREGDICDAFYAIKSGRVQVFAGEESDPIRLADLSAGEIFGEIAALKGIARTATVKATERCEILRLEASDLRSFLDQNTEIKEKVEKQIVDRADETARLLIDELRARAAED